VSASPYGARLSTALRAVQDATVALRASSPRLSDFETTSAPSKACPLPLAYLTAVRNHDDCIRRLVSVADELGELV